MSGNYLTDATDYTCSPPIPTRPRVRFAARVAWQLAKIPNAVSKTFTWEWAVWWTAALIRFSTTGQTVTVTRVDSEPL